ncbi:MAG: LuxR C-terminal-related transcriptional regulator, partial [Oscillospiraceae bacterium]|nr:LuxR C-terminal-related transcriptional regulator [Oscillospiraceae bacterium]
RSLQNAPGYFGYVQNSMRKNIFALMEREAWSEFSPTLRNLILCVSLTRHLAADLVADLCDYEPEIFDEFKAQSAYIRYDSFSDSYSLHPFYLAFLHTKHSALTSRDLHKTYESAARWCERNDFLADALTFYEKIADYDAIVCVLLRLFLPLPCPGELPPETTVQTTKNIAALFEGAPDSAFDNTQYFAALHIAVLSSLSRFDELFEHSNLYEQKLLALTQKSHDSFGEFMELYPKHCSTLCCFYFFLGIIHSFRDPCSDSSALPQNRSFCDYFALMNNYMTADFSALLQSCDFRRGQWLNLNCSDAQNAPQIYADALIRADRHAASQSDSISTGAEDLIIAEYHFYRGDFQSAEPLLLRAAQNAHTRASFDTLHRTLFYRLRTAAAQGDYSKFEDCFRETQLLLSEKLYALRFLACDITGAWYNAVIRRPDHFADWLKDDFAPHAAFGSFDEFANHTKARHLYLSRHYLPLLGFFARSKSCKIALYGRVELLALEACTHYKNNNISAAFATLEDAYLAASANFITTPFAELGKDMRTLASAALKCEFQSLRIPREWLDDIRRKSSTYAKHQSFLIQSVHQLGGVEIPPLSAREKDILRHLCRGLSRPEIMAELSLSRSRINTAVDKIYEKLKAANVADAIRIAIEHKLV